MECRVSELRYKEIINVSDGSRYGWVGDVEVDLESGQVRALVVPGRLRLFGLLGSTPAKVRVYIEEPGDGQPFPWEAVRRFGADTILVETPPLSRLGKGN